MLYISRIKHAPGEGHIAFEITHPDLARHPAASVLYGVVDTDDGREQMITQRDLAYSVCALNMKIAGTAVGVDRETGNRTLLRVQPYQIDSIRSNKQKKLVSLYGVDVVTYNGMVVGINYDGSKLPKVVPIHVSQFGTSCGDYLLINVVPCGHHAVTIILDDAVQFSPASFCGFARDVPGVAGLGAKFDIRGVSNLGAAWYLYSMLYKFGGADSISGSLIDNPERFQAMKEKYERVCI